MPLGNEFFLQDEIILDDTVMDEDKPFGFMRMGIQFGDPPMCSPASMADTDGSRGGITPHHALEVLEFTHGFTDR